MVETSSTSNPSHTALHKQCIHYLWRENIPCGAGRNSPKCHPGRLLKVLITLKNSKNGIIQARVCITRCSPSICCSQSLQNHIAYSIPKCHPFKSAPGLDNLYLPTLVTRVVWCSTDSFPKPSALKCISLHFFESHQLKGFGCLIFQDVYIRKPSVHFGVCISVVF